VNVVRVNIVNAPAKRGRRARSRRLLVRRPSYKKAIITLADGESLEMFEGVQ
jgi:ribosomal protein L23